MRGELAGVLQRLVLWHSSQGAYERAIQHARRWVGLDPLHEPAQRTLMEVYSQAGQQAAALRQYEECMRILREELGLPPLEASGGGRLEDEVRSVLMDMGYHDPEEREW